MANFKAVEATQELIDMMKGNLRGIDEVECKAATNKSADECLQLGLDISEKCWVGLKDEEPYMCFGVAPATEIGVSFRGRPWLLATTVLGRDKTAGRFLKSISKDYINEMLEDFMFLENWVHIHNSVSIKWLEWCGFTIERPVDARPFSRFWMTKE